MTAYDQYTTGYITMTAIDDCTWLISNRTMAYWLLQIVQQGPAINKIISQQEVWTVMLKKKSELLQATYSYLEDHLIT